MIKSLSELYGQQFSASDFQINETKPEFEGDYTIVLFALGKKFENIARNTGKEFGEHLLKNNPDFFSGYNVIKGFLNLEITDAAFAVFS